MSLLRDAAEVFVDVYFTRFRLQEKDVKEFEYELRRSLASRERWFTGDLTEVPVHLHFPLDEEHILSQVVDLVYHVLNRWKQSHYREGFLVRELLKLHQSMSWSTRNPTSTPRSRGKPGDK